MLVRDAELPDAQDGGQMKAQWWVTMSMSESMNLSIRGGVGVVCRRVCVCIHVPECE